MTILSTAVGILAGLLGAYPLLCLYRGPLRRVMQAVVDRIKTKHRVLIADDDGHFARRFCDHLRQQGIEAKVVRTISEAKESVQFWRPSTVFVNLLLPETTALSLIKFINGRGMNMRPRIVVMSKQALPSAVEQMRAAGAHHYLLKPFALEEAITIVREKEKEAAHTTVQKTLSEAAKHTGPTPERELHLLKLVLKQATAQSAAENRWFNLMRMVNIKTKALRCSLIQYINEETSVVVASNDDLNARGLRIDMRNYPEIREVRTQHQSMTIPNVQRSLLLAPVQQRLRKTPYETILLFPVYRTGIFFGVLSLRMQKKETLDIFYTEKFGQVVAQIISMSLGVPGEALYHD